MNQRDKFSRTLKEAFGPYSDQAQFDEAKSPLQKILDTAVCVALTVAALTLILIVGHMFYDALRYVL
jgi:hypothetical protein